MAGVSGGYDWTYDVTAQQCRRIMKACLISQKIHGAIILSVHATYNILQFTVRLPGLITADDNKTANKIEKQKPNRNYCLFLQCFYNAEIISCPYTLDCI